MDTLVLLVNIVGCSLAGAVYFLWAAKWVRRGNPLLVALHAFTGAVGIGFAIGYGLILLEHPFQPIPANAFRPFVGLVLLAPALSRIVELRDTEFREAFARKVKESLGSKGGL